MDEIIFAIKKKNKGFPDPRQASNVNEPSGSAGESYSIGNHTYSSSIDSITNLFYDYYSNDGFTNQTLFVMMHPWSGGSYGTPDKKRWADLGCFVIEPGMRGRDGADGARDASAREIYDIYDAILHAQANYSQIGSKVVIIGYSGGGGNVYGFLSKFPFVACMGISFFGMSDYGYINPTGWWYTNTSYQSDIEDAVGGSPNVVSNNYRSRHALEALPVNFPGYLAIYHHEIDTAVDVVHSRAMRDALNAKKNLNFEYNESLEEDSIQWNHGTPGTNPDLIEAENDIWDNIQKMDQIIQPNKGKLRVIGYLKTPKFEILLDNLDDNVVEVSYDVIQKKYIVNPLIGQVNVTIYQGEMTASQIISEKTIMNVS